MSYLESREQAEAAGHALLARMETPGWELEVFENLGWHYALRRGALNLYPCVNGRFHTLLGDDPRQRNAGSLNWSVEGIFDDPNEAVRAQFEAAYRYLCEMRDALLTSFPNNEFALADRHGLPAPALPGEEE